MMLIIPAEVWRTATATLDDRPANRERIAFLDGPRPGEAGHAVATTVVVPNAITTAGHYAITAEAMSEAGRYLRTFGMRRLAQLHSHPASWTGHSPHDDEMAYSHRDDALSVVVPHYAACAPGVADCGVHVRDNDGWRELAVNEIAERIMIVPSLLDLRP